MPSFRTCTSLAAHLTCAGRMCCLSTGMVTFLLTRIEHSARFFRVLLIQHPARRASSRTGTRKGSSGRRFRREGGCKMMMGEQKGRFSRRDLLGGAMVVGTAGLLGFQQRAAPAEPPPETTRLRIFRVPSVCRSPEWIAEDLLRTEGFTDVLRRDGRNARVTTCARLRRSRSERPLRRPGHSQAGCR